MDDPITPENKEFIREVVQDQQMKYTELAKSIKPEKIQWTPKMQRTGVIARKIGVYPLWLKNGEKITTTLLQASVFSYSSTTCLIKILFRFWIIM